MHLRMSTVRVRRKPEQDAPHIQFIIRCRHMHADESEDFSYVLIL